MRKKSIIYIVLIWVILFLPFGGMCFWATNETTENTELAKMPDLWEEEGPNANYLTELGEYFEDHYAFRNCLVTVNAEIRGNLFGKSPTDQVVTGTDGWLYYGGTIADYQGRNLYTERELFAMIHNLSLIRDYAEANGSKFLLTIAPNKNSLYDENMPYYYQPGSVRNIAMLTERMEENNIPYVDLYPLFEETDEVLYYERDSHWNDKGAVLAYNALLDAMGKEHETYLNIPYTVEKNHMGDIDEMLYPLTAEKEENYIYDKEWKFSYQNDVTDNMDDWIETVQPEKEGCLLMFRDSFGESLLPYMAEEFSEAYFSRLTPYNLTQIEQMHPDYLVIERVERELSDFIEKAPVMEPLQVEKEICAPAADTESTVEVSKEGSYLMIQGTIDPDYLEDDTEIYVSIRDSQLSETKIYPVFYILSGDEADGYQIYLKGMSVPTGNLHINVSVQNDGKEMIVAQKDIVWE